MNIFSNSHFFRIIKHRNTRRILYALLIFNIAIASGVIGYVLIEDMTHLEALYMTIITISTVGFGEVEPLTALGKKFTIFLIVFNIGAFTYALSVLSSFILEGDLKELFTKSKIEMNIEELKNHVIVCGYGRLGRIVCEDLEESGQSVLIVERDPEIASDLIEKGKLVFIGDATEDETITKIGIERASTLITTLHSDANNVFIALATREISSTINIISRASEEANISKMKLAGADNVIIPEDIGGSYIASLVTNGSVKM